MRIRFPDTAFKFSERQQLWHFPFISAVIKLIDLQTLLLNKPLNFFQSFYKRQILNMFNFSAVSHTPQVIYTDIMFWIRLLKQSTVYQLHLVPILLFYWIPSYSLTASRLFEFTTCQTRDNTCKYYTVYYYLLSLPVPDRIGTTCY